MKNVVSAICTAVLLVVMAGSVKAELITIGTADYMGADYNLIWDDDNNGNSVIWLDYTNTRAIWADQRSWASGLDSQLTVTLDGYTVDWTDTAWRLPSAVDGPYSWGTDGTTTAGYNITSSEMGHLYYEELDNSGLQNTDGTYNSDPSAPDYFLQETGDFENLIASRYYYWSGTELPDEPGLAWAFRLDKSEIRQLTITTKFQRGQIFIALKDTGPGIEASILPQLFIPNQSTKEKSQYPGSGFGLGLYISKRILDSYHGEIGVEKTGPGGSVIVIEIPSSTGCGDNGTSI